MSPVADSPVGCRYPSREPVVRRITEIDSVSTSHGVGIKKVLLAASETESKVTQVAMTTLQAGSSVDSHIHPTMDEHFYILEGKAVFTIDDRKLSAEEGTFILIPCGMPHSITALSELKLFTTGIAYD